MKNPKVLLLLSNGFEALEASYFTDILGWSSENGGPTIDVVTCGARSVLKCTWGFSVNVAKKIEEITLSDFDALAIPGGFEEAGFYEDAYSDEFSKVINEFSISGKPIASICVGALALGKAGVLKSRNATTYQLNDIRLQQLVNFGANILYENLVIDKNIITCSSPAAGISVAFELLRKLTSYENMIRVRNLMGFDSSLCQNLIQK